MHVHSASGCNPKRCFCHACYRASYVYASIQGRGRISPPGYQLKPPILIRTHTSNFGWTGIEERGAPMQYYIGDDRSTQGRSSGCLCCGSWSHQKADCPVVDQKCLTLGRVGHLKAACRYGSGPRREDPRREVCRNYLRGLCKIDKDCRDLHVQDRHDLGRDVRWPPVSSGHGSGRPCTSGPGRRPLPPRRFGELVIRGCHE